MEEPAAEEEEAGPQATPDVSVAASRGSRNLGPFVTPADVHALRTSGVWEIHLAFRLDSSFSEEKGHRRDLVV